MSQHADFLAGKPLSTEAERLQRGMDAEYTQPEAEAVPLTDAEEDECRAIADLGVHVGWQKLLRRIDKRIALEQQTLTDASLSDPLALKDKLSDKWAYLAMLRAAREMFLSEVAEASQKVSRLQ